MAGSGRPPTVDPPPSGRPLAWHLGGLCVALLVPTLALGLFLLVRVAGAERVRHQSVAQDAARHAAIAVDRVLVNFQTILEVLGTSDYLRSEDFAAFRSRAASIRLPRGARILLRDRQGIVLTATGETPPGGGAVREGVLALATGQSQVSDILAGAEGGAASFAVFAPARGPGGDFDNLLELAIPVAALDTVLRSEATPRGMTLSVIDRAGRVAAKSGDAEFPGGRLRDHTLALIAGQDEGWIRLEGDEDRPAVAAFARSFVSGWTAVVSLPESAHLAPLQRSLAAAAVIGVTLAAAAAALAYLVARRIARPIQTLAGIAMRMDRHEGPIATPVREVNAVGKALIEAHQEVRRREAALRHNRDLLSSVLEGSADAIFAKDREGRFAILNRPAAELLGTTAEVAVGRRTRDFMQPPAGEEIEAADRDVIATGRVHVAEEEIPLPGGGRRVLLSTRAPWRDASGRTLGVVGVARDITARRDAEARLRATQTELFRASRLNDMGAMAAALAHELNQPLTAAANYAEAAALLLPVDAATDHGAIGEARAAVADAAAEMVRAGRIVQNLRKFIGRSDVEKRSTAINPVIEGALSLALAGTAAQGVTTEVSLAPGLPPVLCDAVQIQQIVVNLVRNAVEAMREAPRRVLSVATRLERDAGVAITVGDTGPGLAPELQDRVFQPFVTTKHDGMGIGLSIGRSIAEAHGGSLDASARPGGGAEFRLLLPALDSALHDEDRDAR